MSCLKNSVNLLSLLRNGRYGARLISTQVSGSLYAKNNDEVTHTGQVFAPDDYRNVRFTNFARQVNPNFGIKLIDEEPIIEREERVVACDGGGGPLGHPKVYINLDKPGAHACGYCGLRFQKKEGHH